MTSQHRRDDPEPDGAPPLDPETVVDELEERVTGSRTGEPDHEGEDPVDDGSGTGIDEESTG